MKPEWFAGRLRELREALNWTREHLAERSGVKEGTIRDIEQGRSKPVWNNVLALAQALHVSVEEFTKEPAVRPPVTPGRPKQTPLEPNLASTRKPTAEAEQVREQPKQPRGRPRKPAPPAEATEQPAGVEDPTADVKKPRKKS